MVAFDIRYAVKPNAPTFDTIKKFVTHREGTYVVCRQWFGSNQGFFFIGRKYEVAAFGRLAATNHFNFPADLGFALGNNQIGRVNQIRIDVGRGVFYGFAFDVGIVVEVFFRRHLRLLAEADDDAVDGGFACGLARPLEGAVGKVDFDALLQKAAPKDFDLLALADGIGGDECRTDAGILRHDAGGFDIPVADVIQQAVDFYTTADAF